WWNLGEEVATLLLRGDGARQWQNQMGASLAFFRGAPGFFSPRVPAPWLHPAGTSEAMSLFDTNILKGTLKRLIDFNRINSGDMRFSVGAVNVRSGNFVYFDNKRRTIAAEHVMANGALPPGFAPVEIEGEHYWDGGLVSNTPLQRVVDSEPRRTRWPSRLTSGARGETCSPLAEVSTRQKEIQYLSRTRASTDSLKYVQQLRRATADLLGKLPDHLRNGPEFGHRQAPAIMPGTGTGGDRKIVARAIQRQRIQICV